MSQVVHDLETFRTGVPVYATDRAIPDISDHLVARTVKRGVDLVVASLLLLVLAPVIAAIALLVAVTSPGPILFRQTRVGKDGVLFSMLKFRSMRVDTAERLKADPELRRLYEANDYKLVDISAFRTPIGRFIRRTSLDELPQLVQVLVGTMSLVGVRPVLPDELATRAEVDRVAYMARRPGLTGLWQVSGRSSLSHEQRCAFDHAYVSNWTLWGDIKILFKTPLAVVRVNDTD